MGRPKATHVTTFLRILEVVVEAYAGEPGEACW